MKDNSNSYGTISSDFVFWFSLNKINLLIHRKKKLYHPILLSKLKSSFCMLQNTKIQNYPNLTYFMTLPKITPHMQPTLISLTNCDLWGVQHKWPTKQSKTHKPAYINRDREKRIRVWDLDCCEQWGWWWRCHRWWRTRQCEYRWLKNYYRGLNIFLVYAV
jgi:hypothetical protein